MGNATHEFKNTYFDVYCCPYKATAIHLYYAFLSSCLN